MQRNHFRNLACVIVATILVGCAGMSSDKSLIRGAIEFAETQGVDADNYSATVTDRGDDYFVLFTRRALLQSPGDHFGVFVNKQTGKYTLDHGR